MGKNFLDQDGQARLKKVLEYAQNDLSRVRDGIIGALKGVDEKGRRTYLWNQLKARAERTIKERLKNEGPLPAPQVEVPLWSQRDLNNAFWYERRLLGKIQEDAE